MWRENQVKPCSETSPVCTWDLVLVPNRIEWIWFSWKWPFRSLSPPISARFTTKPFLYHIYTFCATSTELLNASSEDHFTSSGLLGPPQLGRTADKWLWVALWNSLPHFPGWIPSSPTDLCVFKWCRSFLASWEWKGATWDWREQGGIPPPEHLMNVYCWVSQKHREEITTAEDELMISHSKNKFQHRKSCHAVLFPLEKIEVCWQNVLKYLSGLIFYTSWRSLTKHSLCLCEGLCGAFAGWG